VHTRDATPDCPRSGGGTAMASKEGQKVVEVKKKSYFSGSQYVGEMLGAKRHGKGKKTWKNGDW
jgi:hypothetical protein